MNIGTRMRYVIQIPVYKHPCDYRHPLNNKHPFGPSYIRAFDKWVWSKRCSTALVDGLIELEVKDITLLEVA